MTRARRRTAQVLAFPKSKTYSRRFETDYAGCWPGHSKSREGAINAAIRHITSDGYTSATITDKSRGEVVARVKLSPDRKRAVVEVTKPFRRMP